MEELMKCGHVSMARDDKGNPYCLICDCKEVEDSKPNLEGRMAHCTECASVTNSKWSLPFFGYNEDKDYDSYYCGCHGWD